MPIAVYRCPTCKLSVERIEITSEDKAAPPPTCTGECVRVDSDHVILRHDLDHPTMPMERDCGASSFADVTMRGTWVRFNSNKPPVVKNRGPRSI